MSGLSIIKSKEKFLNNIEGVEVEEILDALKGNHEGMDSYTYFVTYGAINSGDVDSLEFMEYMAKLYADWYFLHKDEKHTSIPEIKLFSNAGNSPINLTAKECIDIIRNPEYRDVLPVVLQYINKLEDRFYVSISCDKLYGRAVKSPKYTCRLYLNLPANKIIGFVKEFLDRAYLEEFSSTIKFLNSDNRSDTIVIYTNYSEVQRVVDTIVDMREDYPNKFDGIGEISPLLGRVGDFIGFGENLDNGSTYFKSRAVALDSLNKMASREVLKNNLLEQEKKIIYRTDDSAFTPTEYLLYLIRRSAVKLIEEKILSLEDSKYSLDVTENLKKLYKYREDVDSILIGEVDKLKKSITRNTKYTLSLDNIGESNYDYVDKLYSVFTSEEDRLVSGISDKAKKRVVASNIFRNSKLINGLDTRVYLEEYFRAELVMILEEILESDTNDLKTSRQSSILSNLKKKQCIKLKQILKKISDTNDDEGKVYITDCINDYLRMLSTDDIGNIEIWVDDRRVVIDSDVSENIIGLFPSLQNLVDDLVIKPEFIDKILRDYGINPDNICLNIHTKCKCRKRRRSKDSDRNYYYNPEGFLGN